MAILLAAAHAYIEPPGLRSRRDDAVGSAHRLSSGDRLAAALSEERDALEDIHEPFLIQAGFLDRTPRGRVATARAYDYFGLTAPQRDKLW